MKVLWKVDDDEVIELQATEEEFKRLLDYVKSYENEWDWEEGDDIGVYYYNGRNKFSLMCKVPDDPFGKMEITGISWDTDGDKVIWVYP